MELLSETYRDIVPTELFLFKRNTMQASVFQQNYID